MIITCPDCETQFLVDVADIAPDGRDVRCSRCDYQWYVAPVIEKSAPSGIAAASSIATSAAAKEALADEDYQSKLPVPVSQRGPGWRLVVSLMLLLLIAAGLGALYMERNRVIDAWPPASAVYERLGLVEKMPVPKPVALQLRDVRLSGDEQALVVSGLVSGPAAATLAASLSVRVEDAAGNGLYQAVVTGNDLVSDPQGARFSVSLPALPDTAHGLLVTLD